MNSPWQILGLEYHKYSQCVLTSSHKFLFTNSLLLILLHVSGTQGVHHQGQDNFQEIGKQKVAFRLLVQAGDICASTQRDGKHKEYNKFENCMTRLFAYTNLVNFGLVCILYNLITFDIGVSWGQGEQMSPLKIFSN
jgi:hypothetical protein